MSILDEYNHGSNECHGFNSLIRHSPATPYPRFAVACAKPEALRKGVIPNTRLIRAIRGSSINDLTF